MGSENPLEGRPSEKSEFCIIWGWDNGRKTCDREGMEEQNKKIQYEHFYVTIVTLIKEKFQTS